MQISLIKGYSDMYSDSNLAQVKQFLPKFPALERKVWKAKSRQAKDAKVHRLEGEGLLPLVKADAVEALVGPVVLLRVPANWNTKNYDVNVLICHAQTYVALEIGLW